jgi:F-type H+-transporting ATPase subunit delta
VRVVSAVALEGEQAKRMSQALAKRFEREIELENEVDPAVLGGAVIYAGDEVIDGSVRGRLARLQNSLA